MLHPTASLDRDGAPGAEPRVAVTARRDHPARRPAPCPETSPSAFCTKSDSTDLASAGGRAGRRAGRAARARARRPPGGPRRRRPGSPTEGAFH